MKIEVSEKFYLINGNFPYIITSIDDRYVTYRRMPDRLYGRDNTYAEKRVYKSVFIQDLEDGRIIAYDEIKPN